MKITSFFPEIFVKDMDKALKTYVDDFGFTVKHKQENGDAKYYILNNEEGDRLALVSFPTDEVSEGFFAMRMNVANVEEAVDFFISRGYKNPGSVERNGLADIHGHAKYELLVSADGKKKVDVIEHQK